MSDSFTAIAPDALFVVACPVCQGQVAALGSLGGRDACCPLCASLFHVPQPTASAVAPPAPAEPAPLPAADPAPEPTAQPGGLGEDWGRVITQLAPVRTDPEPEPAAPPAPADFELPAAFAPTLPTMPEAAGASVAVPPETPAPTVAAPAARQFEATQAAAAALEAEAVEAAEVVEITDVAPPLRAPPRRESPHPAAADQLPVVGGTMLDPKASELAFSEPVRTVRHGDTVIEIRRLTPEERRARRVRRNILMIVIGVSILLMVVILLGVGR